MTDVRALLRQQTAARRVDHPYAAYSEAGKLLCTLCREQIRAESQWQTHIQSETHKERLAATTKANADAAAAAASAATAQKRKLDDTGDDDGDVDMDEQDAARRKRTKPDAADQQPSNTTATTKDKDRVNSTASPSLIRRKSTTPSQGVEIQIPSRPTTPAHNRERSSSSSTSLVGGVPTSLPSRQASNLNTPNQSQTQQTGSSSSNNTPKSLAPATTAAATATATTTTTTTTAAASSTAKPPTTTQVNESEWAAFEADIAAAQAPYDDDAVISRGAMTAEESAATREAAAQAENENPEARKSKADVDLEDDREEATRALEDEFGEMQELEARVQRLKEKREAILKKRRESQSQSGAVAPGPEIGKAAAAATQGKENVNAAVEDAGDEEEDDEDDNDDTWDAFRFHAAAR